MARYQHIAVTKKMKDKVKHIGIELLRSLGNSVTRIRLVRFRGFLLLINGVDVSLNVN